MAENKEQIALQYILVKRWVEVEQTYRERWEKKYKKKFPRIAYF